MRTEEQWWEELEEDWEDIKWLVQNYHPKFRQGDMKPMKVTAPGAQTACDNICAEIQKEPTPDIDLIFRTHNTDQMLSVLNSAWFGVPESTDCWSIPGFSEMVCLLEDPPE